MKKSDRQKIIAACQTNDIVRVYVSGGHVDGFAVAVGETFYALEIFDGTVHLN